MKRFSSRVRHVLLALSLDRRGEIEYTKAGIVAGLAGTGVAAAASINGSKQQTAMQQSSQSGTDAVTKNLAQVAGGSGSSAPAPVNAVQ